MPGHSKDDLVDVLLQMIRSDNRSEVASSIEAREDPIAVGSAFDSVAKTLYREDKDVTRMLVAAEMGLNYCLRKAILASDEDEAKELKRLGRVIAYNTATNCWPGWGDAGIVIESLHLNAALGLATKCLELTRELGLKPRALGGAYWLIGALELAIGRFGAARVAFEQAERVFLADEGSPEYAFMARGYFALSQKADPQCHLEGIEALNKSLDQLRSTGSKDAIFFADQISTAERLLFSK